MRAAMDHRAASRVLDGDLPGPTRNKPHDAPSIHAVNTNRDGTRRRELSHCSTMSQVIVATAARRTAQVPRSVEREAAGAWLSVKVVHAHCPRERVHGRIECLVEDHSLRGVQPG